jgi:hypothetical protein
MKKLLMIALFFITLPTFAQVSSVPEVVDGVPVDAQEMTPNYDQMVMPGQPFYPTLMYPNLSQDLMLKAALEMSKQEVAKAYGDVIVVKLDNAIARILAKAKTVAKTKEWQAYFLWEITNKIMMVQQQFYNSSNPLLHVLNYLWYTISLETMNILYGDMGKDIDGLLEWIEGPKN